MPILSVAKDYAIWHYSRAYADICYIWWNYLWFVNHLFSVPEVLGSLFSPFKRLQEEKVSIMKSPEDFFSNLAVNILMRIVGFVIRSAIIIVALIGFLLVLSVGSLFLALWTVLPALVLYFFVTSINVLFL